jgi:uncharacterized membrane protein HdeD (DUF308 family)
MLYSVVFYMVVGVFVVYTGVVKVLEIRDMKTSDFDGTVFVYIYLEYLLPHIIHLATGVRQKR